MKAKELLFYIIATTSSLVAQMPAPSMENATVFNKSELPVVVKLVGADLPQIVLNPGESRDLSVLPGNYTVKAQFEVSSSVRFCFNLGELVIRRANKSKNSLVIDKLGLLPAKAKLISRTEFTSAVATSSSSDGGSKVQQSPTAPVVPKEEVWPAIVIDVVPPKLSADFQAIASMIGKQRIPPYGKVEFQAVALDVMGDKLPDIDRLLEKFGPPDSIELTETKSEGKEPSLNVERYWYDGVIALEVNKGSRQVHAISASSIWWADGLVALAHKAKKAASSVKPSKAPKK